MNQVKDIADKISHLSQQVSKNHTSEKEQQNSKQKALLCEVFRPDDPIETGHTKYCPDCQTNKKVFKKRDDSKYGGYSHYVEACECDIKVEKEKFRIFKEQQKQELKDLILKIFPIEDDFKTYQISKFIKRTGTEDALNYAKDYIEGFESLYKPKGIGLLISGAYGNGKTHLSKCILNYLRLGNTVIFIEFVSLFDKIQATYSKESEFQTEDIYKCLIGCDLLVVDDIGVGEWKPDREKILLRVIDERKKLKRPIIFTMNPEGEKQLSGRTRSRIDEICFPVVNIASDFRPEILQMQLGIERGEQ